MVDLLESGSMNLLVIPKVMKEMLDNPQYSPKQVIQSLFHFCFTDNFIR